MTISIGQQGGSVQNSADRDLRNREPGSISVHCPVSQQTEIVEDQRIILNKKFLVDPCSKDAGGKYSERLNAKILALIQSGVLPERTRLTGGELNINSTDITRYSASNAMRYPETAIPTSTGELRALLRIRQLKGGALPKEVKEINFISGVCLFSVPGALAVCEDGSKASLVDPYKPIDKPIVAIEISKGLSFYEAESIARSTSFLSAVIHGIKAEASAVFHVPREEYYIYALDLVEKGLMPLEIYHQWVKEVDDRGKLLCKEIAASGIDVELVKITNPLAAVRDILVEGGSSEDTLVRAANRLSGRDPIWRSLLDASPPKDLKELNGLSYIYAYVRHSQTQGEDGVCAAAVENPSEEKIFVELQRISKKIRRQHPMSIAGLYLHEKIMIKDGETAALLPAHPGTNIIVPVGIGRMPAPSVHSTLKQEHVITASNSYWSELKAHQLAEVIRAEYGNNGKVK